MAGRKDMGDQNHIANKRIVIGPARKRHNQRGGRKKELFDV